MLKVARIGAWFLATAIVVLSVVPPGLRPETGAPHRLEHFAIFAATGFAFGLGYGWRHGRVLAGLVIFTGAVEITQLFVPGRHARLSDFIIDALAICVGLLLPVEYLPMNKLEALLGAKFPDQHSGR
jgi:VanZ family protein